MPKEGIEVLTEKQKAFFFPTSEEVLNAETTEKLVKTIYAVSENVERRKKIQKFTTLDVQSDVEDIVLVFPSQIALAEMAEEEVDDEELKKIEDDVVCTICGEKGHISVLCPNRQLRKPDQPTLIRQEDSSTYVPIHMRKQADGTAFERDFAIRLINVPPTVDEVVLKALLFKLLGKEGLALRIYFQLDYETNARRDCCFINFATKEIAEKAIEKLDGYLIDSAKLSCSMARKRAQLL
ncbi:hypothetical protein EIN_495450 [Entamoeba invadens IP1]|uniref:CCHC-type domain-containing protein n=1 Tax=Entamoeba invadens IP1 TaxID=370355 RepID=A0A0A1U309_ENTIV|nr:hypothetical protein EIN_495450 [Entamoeba invadens IP1]ELP87090.1 hypothetical protein EIN_495450 [Entamoeba invadens IP1]|eukprot:XP_004253861.1 hypothetical protein EIN_495450 [Entamoeba invadens IP1]